MLRLWIAAAGALLTACGASSPRDVQPDSPPTVIVILTDDQGFGDLGVHGNPVLRTPSIDAMAARSARFQHFYVSPVCAPTRASLMTGRYHYRTRVVDTWLGRAMMDPDEITIAELLRESGDGAYGIWKARVHRSGP